jgi:hypothetical protein
MHDEEQECNSTLAIFAKRVHRSLIALFLPFIVYFPVRQLLPEIYYSRRSGEWVRVYSALRFPPFSRRAFFRALAAFLKSSPVVDQASERDA